VSELREGALVAGKFRIESLLGRGGMGVVYRATQLPMGRPVALKVLRAELTDDPRARARFEREARIASALDHPAAVAIHDFGEHRVDAASKAIAYLAMELVEGEGLRATLAQEPSTARVIDLAAQLADVLAAAHASGLVHRDLKPENVIVQVGPDGERVRVLDFGLAFAIALPEGGRMTREGVVVGTPEYLSPEQARGESVGPATDVYALGCMLHELLTRRPPFTGGELDVLTKQMFAPPPPLRRENEVLDVPVVLDELRRAMLDKRPDARPGAVEVRDRLRALDPDPDRARARARIDGFHGPRAMRMVDAPKTAPADGSPDLVVGVVGSVDASLSLALSANGIALYAVTEAEPIDASTSALFVPDATLEGLAHLARTGPPIVAGLDRSIDLASVLRAGASDVVHRPFSAADLARKLRRIARDRARRT
jgi:serine/threonine protein kinase